MDGQDSTQEDVKFKAKDILKKEKAEYFVNTRVEKPTLKDRLKKVKEFLGRLGAFFFKGKRKWFTLGGVVVVVVAVLAVVALPGILNPPLTPQEKLERRMSIGNDAWHEAMEVGRSEDEKAIANALAVFDDAIEKQNDEYIKNEIRIRKAEFFVMIRMYRNAIDLLESMDAADFGLDIGQRSRILLTLRACYVATEREDMVEDVDARYLELFPPESAM